MVNLSGVLKTGILTAAKAGIKTGAKAGVLASVKAGAAKLAKETIPALIKKNPKLLVGLSATAGYAAYTGYKWSKNNDTNYDIVSIDATSSGMTVKYTPANADIGVGGTISISGTAPAFEGQTFTITKVNAADEIVCTTGMLAVPLSAGAGGIMNYKCDIETQFNKQVTNGVSSVAGAVDGTMGAVFGNFGIDWDTIKYYVYAFLVVVVVLVGFKIWGMVAPAPQPYWAQQPPPPAWAQQMRY